MSIEFTDLKEIIMEWAEQRKEPFQTSDVYQQIDEAEDSKQASDTIRKLFIDGLLARKKIDGVRFSYALLAYAPDDYEMVQKKDAPEATEANSETAAILEMPREKTNSPKKSPATGKKPRSVEAKNHLFVESQVGQIEIPEGFVLSLKTPGGLVITISTQGAV